MDAETRRVILLTVGAAVGYALVMALNPARPSLRDGLRCLGRYKQIWALPVGFGLCHSAFTVWMRWYEGRVIPDSPALLASWTGWQPPAWGDVLASCPLPTAVGVTAVFNYVVAPFPLSVLWAGCFLVNWRGYQEVVGRGLRRRFGRAGGICIHAALVVGAAAAAFKPVLFVGLIRLNEHFGETDLLRWGEIVNALAFAFEYLLGVGVQIYLMSLCFVWVRGFTFDFDRVRRFALRRFVYVVRWAVVVLAISLAGINLPLILSRFQTAGRRETLLWVEPAVQGTRWLLVAVLLAFCSLQILLVFHNDTLVRAGAEHFRLLRRHGPHVAWLVAVSALHFFLLAAADGFLSRALGPWTWPSAAWSLLLHPVLWAAVASWLLASWVCLFKRCESGRPDADELVRF